MEVSKIENTAEHLDTVEDEKERAKRDSDTASINSAALGDDLPPGYFYSVRFIGAMAVCTTSLFTLSSVTDELCRVSVSRPSARTSS